MNLRGISHLLSTTILILIVLSITSLLYTNWLSKINVEAINFDEIFTREAHALSKKASITWIYRNSTHLKVFLFNYGWRSINVSKVFLNDVEKQPEIYVWDETREVWVKSNEIGGKQLALLIFNGETQLRKIDILDSEGVVIRIET